MINSSVGFETIIDGNASIYFSQNLPNNANHNAQFILHSNLPGFVHYIPFSLYRIAMTIRKKLMNGKEKPKYIYFLQMNE